MTTTILHATTWRPIHKKPLVNYLKPLFPNSDFKARISVGGLTLSVSNKTLHSDFSGYLLSMGDNGISRESTLIGYERYNKELSEAVSAFALKNGVTSKFWIEVCV